MAKIDGERKHNLEILSALNRAIEEGPWEFNLFFKATGKKLIEIRDRFKSTLHLDETEDNSSPATLVNRIAQRKGLIEVFVSLYNADGSNLVRWEKIIASMGGHAVTRPTYRNEVEAKAVLRQATNKQNEAYIAVYIREQDILHQNSLAPQDRHGHELLVLKEKAIYKDYITRFMHVSGFYDYEDGKLMKRGAVDFL